MRLIDQMNDTTDAGKETTMSNPTTNADADRTAIAAPAMAQLPAPLTRGMGDGADHDSSPMDTPAMTGMPESGSVSDGDGQPGLVHPLPISTGWVSRLAESESPLDAVLSAQGHDRRCRRRVRAGLAISCQCQTRQPAEDAAIVIGLAMRFARTGLSRRLPLPLGIVDQLARHVGRGDPAAIVVWDWLASHGLVAARVMPRTSERPGLRLVCEETR